MYNVDPYRQPQVNMAMAGNNAGNEEEFKKVELQPDQFNGLIGNIAGNVIKDRVGGRTGDFLGGLVSGRSGGGGGGGGQGDYHNDASNRGGGGGIGNLIGGILSGGGDRRDGGGGSKTKLVGDLIGGLLSNKGHQEPSTGGHSSSSKGNIGGIIGGILSGGGHNRDGSGGRDQNRGGSGSGGYDPYNNTGGGGGYDHNRGAGGGGAGFDYNNRGGGGSGPRPGEYDPYGGGAGSGYDYNNRGGGYDYNRGGGGGGGGPASGGYDPYNTGPGYDYNRGGGGGSGGYDPYAHPNTGGGHQPDSGKGGGFNLKNLGGILDGITGKGSGSGGGQAGGMAGNIGGLIAGLVGGGGNRGKYDRGGANFRPNLLSGGVSEIIGDLIGKAAHRFLGVDPRTGKIIGSVAGNVIFHLGGKDNSLGNIGKVILDNIVTGKFKRDVDPFVPPEPSARPRPPSPSRLRKALDFYAERDRCLKERRLFEDPEFPAADSSLFFSRRPISERVTWLRPSQITKDPQLIWEGQTRFDVIQGKLGDCWLLAAAANLTLRDELFYRVVPPDQSFTENYAGIFHFQFWQYGKWVDVVIDDRLPTANGELLYTHSRDLLEFWSALLEKAYAKLYGSYEALKGGTTSEALEDMTGGLTEFFDLHNPPPNLLQMMMRGVEMGSLFGCSIEADPNVWEARLSNGLVRGHAYSITGMRIVNGPRGQTPLLRIRNPWGNEQEWNGAWSDNSREWQSVPEQLRREIGLTFAHDGEFWMSFEDFMRHFEKMEICNLGPDVMDEVYQMTGVKANAQPWSTNIHNGEWIRGRTAGGCRNYINTFANNPQYRVRLTDSDPDDDDDLCTVIIAVMQKYRRELKSKGLENLAIGFVGYDAGRVSGRLNRQYFEMHKSEMRSPAFINLREMTGRFRVPPGNYVIVPSSYEPNEEAEFMLRIFTNGFIESAEI